METLGLILKVFWAPAEAMFLISKKPRILVPLLLLTAVSLGSAVVTFNKVDMMQIMVQRAEQRGQVISEEQRAAMSRMSSVMIPATIASATLGTAIFITVAAAIYFGVFTIIGRQGDFKAFYAVTVFAFLPLMFRSVVAALQATFVPPAQLVLEELGSMSLAVFLDPIAVSKLVYGIASVIDVISIWVAVLLIIGFKFVTTKSVTMPTRVAGVVVVYAAFSAIGVALRMLRP